MTLLQSRHIPVALTVTAAALVLIGGVYVSTTIGLGRAVDPQPDATADPTLDVSADVTPEPATGDQPILSDEGSGPTEVAPVEEPSVEEPATSRFLPFRIAEVAEGAGPEGNPSSDGSSSVGSGVSVETDVDSTDPPGVSQPDGVELAETPAPTPQATANPTPEATATPTPPAFPEATSTPAPTATVTPAATVATPTATVTPAATVAPPAATPTATATATPSPTPTLVSGGGSGGSGGGGGGGPAPTPPPPPPATPTPTPTPPPTPEPTPTPTPVPAQSELAIQGGQGTVGMTIPLQMSLNAVQVSLSGFFVTVAVEDPAVAQIVAVQFPDYRDPIAGVQLSGLVGSLPAASVGIAAVDLAGALAGPFDTKVLATISVELLAAGSTQVSVVAPPRIDDDAGQLVAVTLTSGALIVSGP